MKSVVFRKAMRYCTVCNGVFEASFPVDEPCQLLETNERSGRKAGRFQRAVLHLDGTT